MFSRIGRTASVALILIALGFVFIYFAWNGSAKINFVDGQIPYLLSGGAAGLGFIGLGAGMLLFEGFRRTSGRLEEKLDELIETLKMTAAPSAPTAPQVPVKSSRNGATVIVGRSSFHLPDCRLVEGKEGLEESSRDAAVAAGLQPCRVCDPLGAQARKR